VRENQLLANGRPQDSAAARRKVNRGLIKYSYAILAGLLGLLIADHYFPLLDRGVVLIVGVCILFAPVLFHAISSVRRRLAVDLVRLRRTYLITGGASIFLALLVAANGALDRSAAVPVRTAIVGKQVVRGRYGPSYTLKVRSWRVGRNTDSLGVDGRIYGSSLIGETAVVEMHRGVFGLAWYGGVAVERGAATVSIDPALYMRHSRFAGSSRSCGPVSRRCRVC
jgi:hypothetical protein